MQSVVVTGEQISDYVVREQQVDCANTGNVQRNSWE